MSSKIDSLLCLLGWTNIWVLVSKIFSKNYSEYSFNNTGKSNMEIYLNSVYKNVPKAVMLLSSTSMRLGYYHITIDKKAAKPIQAEYVRISLIGKNVKSCSETLIPREVQQEFAPAAGNLALVLIFQ